MEYRRGSSPESMSSGQRLPLPACRSAVHLSRRGRVWEEQGRPSEGALRFSTWLLVLPILSPPAPLLLVVGLTILEFALPCSLCLWLLMTQRSVALGPLRQLLSPAGLKKCPPQG